MAEATKPAEGTKPAEDAKPARSARPARRTDKLNLPALLDAVRILSPSRDSGVHGEEHWRRVAMNGLYLADEVSADPVMVVLFGLFHDSMRFNDFHDSQHGTRAAFLACCLNEQLLGLPEAQMDVLYTACAEHSGGRPTDDMTIGACWDADRLDICRLGDAVDIRLMSTVPGRTLGAQRRAQELLETTPSWEEVFTRLKDGE